MCPEGVFFIGPEHDGHTGLRSDEQVRTRAIADSLPANQPTVCVNGRIPGLKAEYRQRTRCPQVVGESLRVHSFDYRRCFQSSPSLIRLTNWLDTPFLTAISALLFFDLRISSTSPVVSLTR